MYGNAHIKRLYHGSVAIALLIVMVLSPVVSVYAEDVNGMQTEIDRLLKSMDINGIQKKVPELELEPVLKKAASGVSIYEPQWVIEEILNIAKKAFKTILPQMMRIFGIGVLSVGLSHVIASRETAKVCELVGCLCTATIISVQAAELMAHVRQVMHRMTDFTTALLPSLIALMTACGGMHSAAGLQRLSLAATGGFAEFFRGSLLNLLSAAAAMVLTDAVMNGTHLKGFCKLLRSTVHWMMGVCVAVFLGCLAIQGGAGTHYDGIALRAAKYTMDKSIPIVGGLFKEAADTFVGCALMIRYALGTAGLTALMAILAVPALEVLCSSVGIRLYSALLEPFGAERMCRMLTGFADILMSALILISGTAMMNLAMVAAMMYTGMEFI